LASYTIVRRREGEQRYRVEVIDGKPPRAAAPLSRGTRAARR
jgi:hypothetical protein